MRATRPTRMVEHAIAGMLPKTKLGKQMYRKLKVYAGDKHPHQAQKPVSSVRLVVISDSHDQERYLSGRIGTASRNGPPQDLGGAHFPAIGQRPDHGQRPALRKVFRQRSRRAPSCGSRCWRPKWPTSSTFSFWPTAADPPDRPERRGWASPARCIEFNSELRPKLKQLGLLTRDPRAHERKKYGQKGARKRFQFSKR